MRQRVVRAMLGEARTIVAAGAGAAPRLEQGGDAIAHGLRRLDHRSPITSAPPSVAARRTSSTVGDRCGFTGGSCHTEVVG
jgi:hypothetical protein